MPGLFSPCRQFAGVFFGVLADRARVGRFCELPRSTVAGCGPGNTASQMQHFARPILRRRRIQYGHVQRLLRGDNHETDSRNGRCGRCHAGSQRRGACRGGHPYRRRRARRGGGAGTGLPAGSGLCPPRPSMHRLRSPTRRRPSSWRRARWWSLRPRSVTARRMATPAAGIATTAIARRAGAIIVTGIEPRRRRRTGPASSGRRGGRRRLLQDHVFGHAQGLDVVAQLGDPMQQLRAQRRLRVARPRQDP
ncbi:hypothetical protein OJJOAM_004940 [Cupriavidus sp. H18C1]